METVHLTTSSATAKLKRIPLVDLTQQHEELRTQLENAYTSTLDSGTFIEGPSVSAFEKEFADYCEVSGSVAVDSGTAALHLALLALDIQQGDEVVVPAHTFIATAAAVVHAGAKPVFVDADPETWQMDARYIDAAVTDKTRAIIAVHLYGLPVDIEQMCACSSRHNVYLIEDAAQAHGARFRGQRIGSFGDMACFSFYPAKNLGALGDGGAITTGSELHIERLRRLRNHGRLTKYEHGEVGYNYRMDAVQGAVLSIKLRQLDRWNHRRRQIAAAYRERLAQFPLRMPKLVEGTEPVYHLFTVHYSRRDELAAFLGERNIDTGVHYPVPLHLQPAFQNLGYKKGDFPVSERIGAETLSLPIFPEMTEEQLDHVCSSIAEYFQR